MELSGARAATERWLAGIPGLLVRPGQALARLSTLRIGGPAETFVEVASERALVVLLQGVAERPVFGGNRLIVGDIIPKVRLRRGEEGGNPDRFESQIPDVIQFLDNALNVADPVAIAVIKRARVDLIDGGFVIPGSCHCLILLHDTSNLQAGEQSSWVMRPPENNRMPFVERRKHALMFLS